VNQVLQRALAQENRARENQSQNQFRDGLKEKEQSNVGLVEGSLVSDEDTGVCVAEWADMPKGKPMTCTVLKLEPGKKEEMKFTFDDSE
jgi:hypothetical protein